MRILLDSNMWRYVLDTRTAGALQSEAARHGAEILVAPAVLYEALRISDRILRRALAEIMTRPAWKRLMPDAFLECEEIISEIRRLRPEWLRKSPDLQLYRRLRHDWRRKQGGFWDRARNFTNRESEILDALGGVDLELARSASIWHRQQSGADNTSKIKLREATGTFASTTEGWAGEPVELWRLSGYSSATRFFRLQSSAYYQWLYGLIDISKILTAEASWVRFWLYDVDAVRMPRHWLRSAFELMQVSAKVTPGTPADAQISSSLIDADVFVSADKGFVAMAKRAAIEGPIKIAQAQVLRAHKEGVDALVEIIRSKSGRRETTSVR